MWVWFSTVCLSVSKNYPDLFRKAWGKIWSADKGRTRYILAKIQIAFFKNERWSIALLLSRCIIFAECRQMLSASGAPACGSSAMLAFLKLNIASKMRISEDTNKSVSSPHDEQRKKL